MSKAFLESIWPWAEGTYAELRMIRGGKVRQEFYEMIYLRDLLTDASVADAEGWDCYIGALPRTRQSGKAEDCTPTTTVLWSDLDNKTIGGSHLQAFLSLQKAGLEPSILVDSGNGIHAWWLLRSPIAFDKAQAAMKGLHKLIGSDSVHDAPRVLRLPGTMNHKGCDHEPLPYQLRENDGVWFPFKNCKPVRLISLEPDRRFRWADFAGFVEEVAPRVQRTGYEQTHMDYAALPDWLIDQIENGAPEGQRSERMFGVCCGLIERGWDDEEIIDLFNSTAIGDKLTEMSDREATRYMRRTIERAREVVE